MGTISQQILRGLRFAKLIGPVDWALYRRELLRHSRDNEAFRREHPGTPLPPFPLMFDAYNHCSYRGYHEDGARSARFVVSTIRRFRAGNLTVCEWGCGPARTLRHLKALDSGFTRVIGTDYNAETIAWCREAFPDLEFEVNGLGPPLPLASASVDVLCAFSVFTHLSLQMHMEWIGEIRRVLRPGGMIFFTTHGERCAGPRLLPDERALFDRGELVVREGSSEGKKHFASYASERFVRDRLLAGFVQVEPIDWPGVIQDAWVARVPA